MPLRRVHDKKGNMAAGDLVKVSFVIPNYQGEELLNACLSSIYAQETDIPFEVIVVDDKSTDGSVAMVKQRYPSVRLIANQRNRGPAESKNIGAREALGDFIAFLDNDVELDKHWLRSIYGRLMAEGEEAGACASHILLNGHRSILNSTGGFVDMLGYAWDRGIFEEDNGSFSRNTEVMYACSAAMLIRRTVYELVGGFDRRYRYLYEDVDLGWRVNACGFKVYYEPEAIAHHHLSSTMGKNGLRNLYLTERNRMRTLKANLEKETRKTMSQEYLFHFKERLSLGMDADTMTLPDKLRLTQHMLRALGWNILHSRSIVRRRRALDSMRKRHDWELMRSGILSPYIVEPQIEVRTFLRKGQASVRDGRRVFPGRVVMELESGGCIGPGWYDRELNEDGVAFRWTAERASVIVQPQREARHLILHTLMANPRERSRVSLLINGRAISSLEVPDRFRASKVRLPEDMEPGAWDVELAVENPFTPQDELGIDDRRALGIAVTSIQLR
jgi:GT2 family glycosyltransferase